jgi:hypothetical protein
MLRAIPDSERVATILADALKAYLEQQTADNDLASQDNE